MFFHYYRPLRPLGTSPNFGEDFYIVLFVCFLIGIMRGGSISKSPPKLGGVPLAGRGSVKTFGITAILSPNVERLGIHCCSKVGHLRVKVTVRT